MFIIIYSINLIPGYAAEPAYVHNNTNGNNNCNSCHFSSHAASFQQVQKPQTNPGINSIASSQTNLHTLEATNVIGNITLITSMGQDWFQQGIYGPDGYSNMGGDQSWGWTFFDQNPSSRYITPDESVIQRETIYALLLDDGNNSNPISGANVVANITFWMYDGASYTSNITSVLLIEDINRKGFYNGRFNFSGGTTYAIEGNMCSGCHNAIFGVPDTQIGYFPGNYTVSIRAEADGKIKNTNLNFEVTPWGCEDCHGSGNQHHAQADMDSACYICHGINTISGMSDAGNPHQNSAHINIQCTDCHTNKSLNAQTFDRVTFGGLDGNKPQYKNNTIQLNGGTHSAMACYDCHNNLSLPGPQGGFGNYNVSGTINSYDPSFASLEQFEDYYVINVESSDSLNINLNWNSAANLGFYLYPPDFNPKNRIRPPYYDGATSTNKPEIYINSAPMPGKWILAVYGYDLRYDFLAWNWMGGVLQPPINYTVNSTHPIQRKDLPSTPECNNCHNSGATGGANTIYEIPDWNPGFAHVDTNNDSTLDVQCRMCHDAMHNITIKDCHNCHTTAPTTHPIKEPRFSEYTPAQCLECHGDPHRVTSAGGTDCIACHASTTNDFNITAFGQGVHLNINKTDGNGLVNNSDCWTCHYQKDMDRLNIYTCVNCHVNGIVPEAPQITSHKPEKTNKSSCGACHDLVKLNPGLNNIGLPYPNITSHYAQLPTVTTPNYCDNCHGPDASSLFQAPYRNITSFYHNSSNVSFPGNSTCRTCHTRTDVTTDPRANDNSNFHNMTTEYGDVKNNTKIANCVYCHVDQDSNFSNAPLPSHSTTDMVLDTCYKCHGTKVTGTNAQKLHDVQADVSTDCVQCHVGLHDVNTSMFGRHINLNTTQGGPNNMTDDDCRTCHFGSKTGDLPMIPNGANYENTYICDDCHTSAGTGRPLPANLKPTDLRITLRHGSNKCISCHAPDMYHVKGTAGPGGRVENPGWQLISPIDYAGCLDCHLTHNGLDAPFHGPGIDPDTTSGIPKNHIAASDGPNNGSGCKGSCHNYVVHNVQQSNNTKKPTLSTPVLFPIIVVNNDHVEVITRGSAQDQFTSLQIEAAQYQVKDNSGYVIIDWTAMDAKDGRFNSSLETVNATISTTGLSEGTYNVSVRVMASGPKPNILPYKLLPYYPLNGDWSTPLDATFFIKQSGFINGTVRNTNGSGIPGAKIITNNLISAVTNNTGFYYLSLSNGTYDLIASKDLEYYINDTLPSVVLESVTTATRDFILTKKPTGTISGIVKNI